MHVLIASIVALFIGLAAGTFHGQRMERKEVARILFRFHLVSAENRSAVNRLWSSLPWLEKYFQDF